MPPYIVRPSMTWPTADSSSPLLTCSPLISNTLLSGLMLANGRLISNSAAVKLILLEVQLVPELVLLGAVGRQAHACIDRPRRREVTGQQAVLVRGVQRRVGGQA